jgi:hypothetical protein
MSCVDDSDFLFAEHLRLSDPSPSLMVFGDSIVADTCGFHRRLVVPDRFRSVIVGGRHTITHALLVIPDPQWKMQLAVATLAAIGRDLDSILVVSDRR